MHKHPRAHTQYQDERHTRNAHKHEEKVRKHCWENAYGCDIEALLHDIHITLICTPLLDVSILRACDDGQCAGIPPIDARR